MRGRKVRGRQTTRRSVRPRRLAAVLLLSVLLLWAAATWHPRLAGADASDAVPPAIDAILGSPSDEALAATAVARADEAARPGGSREALASARSLLVLLDGVGLKHAARRLAAGDVPPVLLPHLLLVVAASAHPDADLLLERAAQDPRPEIRAVAADGLGRGRTSRAVPALARLATDALPSVRAAAMRALFALEGPEAVAARSALPLDPRVDARRERLRLHRLREDRTPEVLALAEDAWRTGRDAALRTEAARLLVALGASAPPALNREILREILRENGNGPLVAALSRMARGLPVTGYDAAAMRTVAIAAALVLVRDASDPAVRAARVDQAVGWLARPVPLDPGGKEALPEDALRTGLPDLGDAILEPTLRRLRLGAFRDPKDGVGLLHDLGRASGLPALRSLLDDASVPEAVRLAATGALGTLGVGDEALANRLLDPKEDRVLRRDVVSALAAEPEPWATLLLGAQMTRDGADLVEEAADALERRAFARGDAVAEALLQHEVFRRPQNAIRRLRPLVAAGDDAALDLLARALASANLRLRLAAFTQFQDTPTLRGPRARALVLGTPLSATARSDRTHEIEGALYARVAVAPEEAPKFVRTRWEELEGLAFADTALTMLQEVRGAEASRDVVDLVLEKSTASPTTKRLLAAASALRARTGYRQAEVDAVYLRGLTHEDRLVAYRAAALLQGPGHGDLTAPLLALLQPRADGDLEAHEMADVLQALRWQPFTPAVEGRALALALEATSPIEARIAAADLLSGRMGEASRRRLFARLTETGVGRSEPEVERALALAVGEGAGPALASALASVLEQEIHDRYATPESLDPETERVEEDADRAGALVAAIARSGDAPAMDRVVALVFDARFAPYAQAAVRLQTRRLGGGGAADAARPPPALADLRLATPEAEHPLPPEIARLVEGMKSMDDAALAASLERVLTPARTTGLLARFPDVYLERVLVALQDARSGARHRAADVVAAHVRRVEPVEGASDLAVAAWRAWRLAEERRFAEAVTAQTEVVRIITRRGYDAADPALYVRERAALDALRGAEFAARGLADAAAEAYTRAAQRAPDDVEVLKAAARRRVLAGHDLAAAEADARRAVVLEQRTGGRESLDAADALAETWLRQGRAEEAARLLQSHYDPQSGFRSPGGTYLLHLAEALVAAGATEQAVKPLLQALDVEPGLSATLLDLPWLTPLRDDERLVRAVAEAAARLRRGAN